MYFQYYFMGIILLPALIFATYAQCKVNSTYNEFRQISAQSGITASELVRKLLVSSGLEHIQVRQIPGSLTDHYNPQKEEICLSSDVYSSSSLSALGVACHEFGHALQKKNHYIPYEFRKILVPVSNLASVMLWPLVLIGLMFNIGAGAPSLMGDIFLWSGVGFFGVAVLFNLITLPVEFNASSRAMKILESTNTMNQEELEDTKKVLNAAALTYVAALLVAIMNLVRFLIVALHSRDD